MIGAGPLPEIEASDGMWLEPDAFFHLISRQALAPSTGLRLGEIGERAFGGFEALNPGEYLTPSVGDKAGAHAGGEQEILAAVEADDERVEALRTRSVASYDEFLPLVETVLAPQP